MNQQGQWQVAGSAPEVYERELVPAVFGVWAPILVELAQPRPGERVVDVACGTGIVARIAAERVGPTGAVVGVDLNPGMLTVARSVVSTDSRSAGSLQWQEASADKLPFPDGSFDVVYCQLGLQFFADRAAALREMRRVLRAEGRLALMVWRGMHESPGFALLAEALERHVGQAAATIMRAPFGLSNADELAALVRAAGFQGVVPANNCRTAGESHRGNDAGGYGEPVDMRGVVSLRLKFQAAAGQWDKDERLVPSLRSMSC